VCLAAQAGASAAALRRAWSASSATNCDRASRCGLQLGSAAMRWGMPGSHGSGPWLPTRPGASIRDSMTWALARSRVAVAVSRSATGSAPAAARSSRWPRRGGHAGSAVSPLSRRSAL
jgi:hypothetical protein